MELRAASVNLRPAKWKAGSIDFASNQRLGELLFERLVVLDNYGRFQPQLATEWTRDAAARKWQFTLRQGVKFSDGTGLTPGVVASALEPLLPRGLQIAPTSTGVAIQSSASREDLLEILASGPLFIYKENESGIPRGTGPFRLESVSASPRDSDRTGNPGTQAERLRFTPNENCWSGRPYLDAIEVTLGVPPSKVLLDLQLGKTDLGELSVETAKRAQRANMKFWASAPLTLYALRFSVSARSENDKRLRQAVGLAVDRAAISRVLLQKQAEPAASFLPQWLSGYAFLFDTESNLERAKQLRKSMAPGSAGADEPLRIGVDGNSELSRLIAERLVVDARAAGLPLETVKGGTRPAAEGNAPKVENEARLLALRYTSLSPRLALEALAAAARFKTSEGEVPDEADARYAWEVGLMEEKNLLPLVAVPDFAAADGRVRNWSPSPWGEWRLAEVWLDQGDSPTGMHETLAKPATRERQ